MVFFIVENFKKVFIHCLAMGSIVVYCTIIFSNTLNKIGDCMELKVVKG